MLPFALALPEVLEFASALAVAFGAKKLYDRNKDNLPTFPSFSFDNPAIPVNPTEMDWSNDTTSTIPTQSVIPTNFEDEKSDENEIGYNVDDYVLRKINILSESSEDVNLDNVVSTLNNSVSEVEIPEVQGETLLDVLKGNTDKIASILTALNNTVVSGATTFALLPIALKDISNNIKSLNESILLNNLALSNIYKAINSGVDVRFFGFNDFLEALKGFKVETYVENKTDVSGIVEAIKGIDLSTINEKMSVIAEAKELEKEHFEFMKTPKTYTLTDEALPNLSPREVMALSEAVKAHLNSQEASLTGEELGLDDYDFDLNDVLMKLFNFEGIVKDINNLPKE